MTTSTQSTRAIAGLRRSAVRWDPVALAVAAVLGLLALSGWEALVWDPSDEIGQRTDGVEGWFFATSGASPLPALLLCGWVVWRRRHRLAAEAARPGRSWGAVPLVAASLATAAWAHTVGAPDLLVPALSLGLLGAGVGLAGHGALRVLWIPALLALLALPVPVTLANQILYPLQRWTASVASSALDILGIAHVFLGDQIQTRERLFYVIETCSGLRSILTLLLGTALYCELFYRSRSQVLFLMLAAPAVALAFNQVRVLTIILNPLAEFSTVHTLQGMATLFAAMFLVAGLDWGHGRLFPGAERRSAGAARPRLRRFRPLRVAAALAVAGATLPLALWVPEASSPPAAMPAVSRLPTQLDGWRVEEGLAPDYTFLGSARLSEWVLRRYAHPERERPVDVFVATDDHRHRFHDVLSPKIGLPGPGWHIRERSAVSLGPDRPEATERWLEQRGRRMLTLHWTVGAASVPEEVLRSALVLDRGPLHRGHRIVAVRISTAAGLSSGARLRARQRAREVATLVASELSALGVVPASDATSASARSH